MKKIKLPIDTTLFCQTDLENIDPQNIQNLGNTKVIRLGTINVAAGCKEVELARDNGVQIVYGLLSIEHRMENILSEYLFGPTLGTSKPKKDFFVNEILQSSKVDYFFKKELLNKIIDEHNLLIGRDRDILQNNLKKIMTWRNAFAHGHLRADNFQGCFLDYYSGGQKTEVLNDDFWIGVEDSFKQIVELLKKLKLNDKKETTE